MMHRLNRLTLSAVGAVSLGFLCACGGSVVDAPCEGKMSVCPDGCYDLSSDKRHCGDCDTVCKSNESCEAGQCLIQCTSPETRCGNTCVYLSSNPDHCGRCDQACTDEAPFCAKGRCAAECPDWMRLCDGECVDHNWHPLNCGNCAVRCPESAPVCAVGKCAAQCPASLELCSGACVDPRNDPEHCGQCTKRCDSKEVCDESACAADCGEKTLCGSYCAALQSDSSNCGQCGLACDENELCLSGNCERSCGGGNIQCGGDGCLTPTVNRMHCGGCFRACQATENCREGECIPNCGNLTWCDHGCRGYGWDVSHCGRCGHACDPASEKYCIGGVCRNDCPAPYTVCGESCVDLPSNSGNCGACFRSCLSGVCENGKCRDQSPGHLIAIGHDMDSGNSMIQRLIGNAVFISPKSPVKVLAYSQYTDTAESPQVNDQALAYIHYVDAGGSTYIDKVDSAISAEAAAKGRTWKKTVVTTDADTVDQLFSHHVLLVYRQGAASNMDLTAVGNFWYSPLRTFLSIGGIVVFLDGISANNSGTFKLFESVGLFSCSAIFDASGSAAVVKIPNDAVAQGVYETYAASSHSVFFSSDDNPVVSAQLSSGNPFIIHKVFVIDQASPTGEK